MTVLKLTYELGGDSLFCLSRPFYFHFTNSRPRKTSRKTLTAQNSSHVQKNCLILLARVRSIFGIAHEYYTNKGGVGKNSRTPSPIAIFSFYYPLPLKLNFDILGNKQAFI